MKFGALLSVVFITVFSLSECASLEVLIDGDVAESPISCVGENITFVCTVASLGHAWTVGSFVTRQAVLANDDEDITEVEMFTFRRVSVSGGTITTSLSVLSFSDLNNVMVECVDGGGGAEEQNIVAQVYDPPVLNLTVMSSLTSFVLTPQVTNPECVITIEPVTVTPVCDDDVMREDIPVAIGVPIRVEDYDVCQCTYNFTIVATTLTDELRMTVSQDVPIDLSDAAPITGLVETRSGIVWSPPTNTNGCSFDYVVTEDGSELTRTADISYDYTFSTCRNLTLTVTPVVPSTGEVLTSSSASINVFNSSANDVIGITPDVDVSSSVTPDGDRDVVDISITWTLQGVNKTTDEVVEITRGDARELVVTIPVEGDLEGQYTVMDCNYEETSTTFYVRFIFGGCMSEESDAMDGFITGLSCTGERGGAPIAGIGGGVAGGIVAVAVAIAVVMSVIICKKKKPGKPDEKAGTEPVVTYHSSGATAGAGAGVYESDPTVTDGPGLYADPKAIEHQVAGPGGEEYALVTTKKKQPDPVPTGDLYSVPDKSKKTQNQGLVYADIDVKNPTRPPPAAPRGHAFQPDNEPVMYSTVNM